NNEQRVELIRKSYANDERPAVDMVEAVAQLQTFQYQQNESWFTF
ncbi:MAG: hypothetical protein IPH46_16555, partial [Bacteroidetes bacterium]|nr:hypothetical protein [Bacteroidota bacterium]